MTPKNEGCPCGRLSICFMKKTDPFYVSKKWRHVRDMALRKEGYMDALEKRSGKRVQAQMVHHIFPRESYPQYQYQLWNLIPLTFENHELMHNRLTGGLSSIGHALMAETAREQGIPISEVILVVGLPGSGKTTYVQSHLGGGLAYDLDYISAAFRLTKPHYERHDGARRLANRMLRSFVANAREQVGKVYVIRTAPTIEEAVDIDCTSIVICKGEYNITNRKDFMPVEQSELLNKIDDLREWAQANKVPLAYYPPP